MQNKENMTIVNESTFLSTIISIVVLFFLNGCSSCEQKKEEQQVISGHASVFVADPYGSLISEQSQLFQNLYSNARLSITTMSTEEALVHFLNDSVQIAVIDRTLSLEEQQIVQHYSIPLTTTAIAYDAIAVVVHSYNPIKRLSLTSLKKILEGKITNWREIPESNWSGTIDFVITNKHSGIYYNLKQYFKLTSELSATTILATHNEVLNYVAKHPQTLGFVSYYIFYNSSKDIKREVTLLPVETKSSTVDSIKYLIPTQENIYEQLYPLRYSLYLYTRESKGALGLGFGTFLLTYNGQKIFQNSGITPVKIPSRLIQINVE